MGVGSEHGIASSKHFNIALAKMHEAHKWFHTTQASELENRFIAELGHIPSGVIAV